MPKATRKKKERTADFSKAKLKLGKGKQAASNAVDTSFKARSIALPTQSIAVEKDSSAPTTKRRLTLDDLISNLKHYNANARKDALHGLRELLDEHPELIEPGLKNLLAACVRLIGDEDASVRKALISFFSWLLPQIPSEALAPHSSLLLLFTTSAQTHIFPEIRIDAIRFLDIFLDLFPDLVVEGWDDTSGRDTHGKRVLAGYLGILNAGTKFGEVGDSGPVQATSTASVVLSPGSKSAVLKSLSHFLQVAVSTHSHSISSTHDDVTSTWYLASSFGGPEAYHSFNQLFLPSSSSPSSSSCPNVVWKPNSEVEEERDVFLGTSHLSECRLDTTSTLQELMNLCNENDAEGQRVDNSTSSDVEVIAHIARTLHPTLISTFLDCAPTVFSPSTSSPPETELTLLTCVAEIAKSLYGSVLRNSLPSSNEKSHQDLEAILVYMAPYFPFRVNNVLGKRDIKVEQAYQDLNLIFCELSSLLVLAPSSSTPATSSNQVSGSSRSRPRAKKSKPTNGLSPPSRRIRDVCQYVIQLLEGNENSTSGTPSSGLARPITPAVYSALLPTIWSLLNSDSIMTTDGDDEPVSVKSTVISAVVEHAKRTSAGAASKRLSTEFLARLVLLESDAQYRGSFMLKDSQSDVEKIRDWVVQLPRTLWELGGNNVVATEIILRILLRLFQRTSPTLTKEVTIAIRTRFIPYFMMTHPSRGEIPGPYTKLPPFITSPLRRLVIDAVVTILTRRVSDTSEVGAVELEGVIDRAVAVAGGDDAGYWCRVKSAVRR